MDRKAKKCYNILTKILQIIKKKTNTLQYDDFSI